VPGRMIGLLLLAMLAVATDAWTQGAAPRGGGAGIGRASGPGVGSRINGPGRGASIGQAAGRGAGPYIPPDLSGTGFGQDALRAERRAGILTQSYLFAETGEELPFAIFVPSRVREDEPSPLVIGLHGMGGQPGMFVSQIRDRANKGGYIVAAPMGYNPYGGYGAYAEGIVRTDDPRVSEWSERDVMNVLAIMREQYNIDENRIYLVGQSMGGAGALHLGRKYPEIWAAVGATAPAVRNADAIDFADVTELPFILVHGDADAAVPVDVSRRLALKMQALDMTFEYYEVRRGGHSDAIVRGAKPVFDFFDAHVKGTGLGD